MSTNVRVLNLNIIKFPLFCVYNTCCQSTMKCIMMMMVAVVMFRCSTFMWKLHSYLNDISIIKVGLISRELAWKCFRSDGQHVTHMLGALCGQKSKPLSFQNSFTDACISNWAINWSLKNSSHPKSVATPICEYLHSKVTLAFQLISPCSAFEVWWDR